MNRLVQPSYPLLPRLKRKKRDLEIIESVRSHLYYVPIYRLNSQWFYEIKTYFLFTLVFKGVDKKI